MTRGRREAPDTFSEEDRRFMAEALRLAERGRGSTRPNPVVGAVIVQDGRLLARGYHRRAGGPHAEVAALAGVDGRAPGATMYVTLEPCCHRGRTGPCTEPLIASGVRRVVVGCVDQFPLVAGRGIARLRRAGLRVDVGCLQDECYAANRGFFRWAREGRPHVTLKAAATLDGFIAPAARPRRPGVHWITGEPARQVAHELRDKHDAILVGSGTILADDPRLTVRLAGKGKAPARAAATGTAPLRVVLDGRLRTPPRARLFTEGPPPLVIAAAPPAGDRPAFERRRRTLERAGAEILALPARRGRVPLPAVLRTLAARGIQSLLLEGGAEVHGAFIAARLVDEVALFFAPRLQGAGRAIAAGPGLPWTAPLRLGPLRVQHVGGDILLRADVEAPPKPGRPRR